MTCLAQVSLGSQEVKTTIRLGIFSSIKRNSGNITHHFHRDLSENKVKLRRDLYKNPNDVSRNVRSNISKNLSPANVCHLIMPTSKGINIPAIRGVYRPRGTHGNQKHAFIELRDIIVAYNFHLSITADSPRPSQVDKLATESAANTCGPSIISFTRLNVPGRCITCNLLSL